MKFSGICFLVLVAIGLPPLAYSSGLTAQNGGNAVVCRDKKTDRINTIEVLDVFEARLRGVKLDLGAPALSVSEKVHVALSRLRKFDPVRADSYEDFIHYFMQTMQLVRGIDIVSVDDSMHTVVPSGCKVEQLATQRALHRVTTEPTFVINADLWDSLNNDNKAALLLHEGILQEAVKIGHLKTPPTRLFNSYLFSSLLEQKSLEFYKDLIDEVLIHPNFPEGMSPMIMRGLCKVDVNDGHERNSLYYPFTLEGTTGPEQSQIIRLLTRGGYRFDAIIVYEKFEKYIFFDIMKSSNTEGTLLHQAQNTDVVFALGERFVLMPEPGVTIACNWSVY